MKHLLPETGDILYCISTNVRYTVTDITWSKRLNDYQVTLKDVFGIESYVPMQQLDPRHWRIQR